MTPEAENYRKELTTLGYGRPVYDPDPGDYDRARIGDVGYFAPFGNFRRLFNVLYSENDAINCDGVPPGFVPMREEHHRLRPSQPIPPGVICRSRVKKIGGDFDINDGVLPVGAKFSLSCTEQRWAALVISRHAIRKDAECGRAFKNYIIKNHQAWLEFARDVKQIEVSLEDLVLVTGLDMTHEWATASAFEWNREWEVSLDVKSPGTGRLAATAWCSWTSSVSLPLRFGPIRGSSLHPNEVNATHTRFVQPESHTPVGADAQTFLHDEPNQCVFMRGFRVIPRGLLPSKIKAAAEPKDENAREEDEGTIAVCIGVDSDDGFGSGEDDALDQCNTFKAAQDYIFMNSDADFAVLHDDDLYKFNIIRNENEGIFRESENYGSQGVHLETVGGLRVASLSFGEASENGNSSSTIRERNAETLPSAMEDCSRDSNAFADSSVTAKITASDQSQEGYLRNAFVCSFALAVAFSSIIVAALQLSQFSTEADNGSRTIVNICSFALSTASATNGFLRALARRPPERSGLANILEDNIRQIWFRACPSLLLLITAGVLCPAGLCAFLFFEVLSLQGPLVDSTMFIQMAGANSIAFKFLAKYTIYLMGFSCRFRQMIRAASKSLLMVIVLTPAVTALALCMLFRFFTTCMHRLGSSPGETIHMRRCLLGARIWDALFES